MRKVKLNEDIDVSYSNYKPILKNEKFESSEANYRIALENVRRTIDATAKSEKARKEFKASLLNGDVPNELALAIKVLNHVANVKNLTSVDKTKAILGNKKIRANEVEEARKSLSELYDVPVEKFDEIEIDEKITNLADKIVQKKYIAPEETQEPTKAEQELNKKQPEEEPEPEEEEEPDEEEPEEEEPDKKEAPKTEPKQEQPKETKTTGKAPQELVSDLKTRFEDEASKALDFIKKAGYDERAGKKIIENLRTKLTKYNNKILSQEDSLNGDYGFNTNSRAQQAINLAANNSNYIIDSIANRTFLKASPSNIVLLGRQAAEDLSNIGNAIKNKATDISKSKVAQTAGSAIQKGYQTLKGKTVQAVDKIGEKIVKYDKASQEKKDAKAVEKAKSQLEKTNAIKSKTEPSNPEDIAKEIKSNQKTAADSIKKASKLSKNLPKSKQTETPAKETDVSTATPEQAEKANAVLSGPSGKAGEDRIAALKARSAPQYTPPPVAPAPAQIPAPVPQANLPAVANPAPAPTQQPPAPPQPGTPNYEQWKKTQKKKGAAASVDIEGEEEEGPDKDMEIALTSLDTSFRRYNSSKKSYEKKKQAFLNAMKNKAGI